MSFSRPVFVVIIAIAFPPRSDKTALVPLLLLALLVLLVLANSAAEYFGVRRLLSLRQQVLGIGVLTVTALACTPALAVERPWEYHNAIGGGTRNGYRYFRNEGVDLGQRDREIAEYCHRHLERFGEVPYVVYEPSLLQADLVRYLRLRLKVLDDPSAEEFHPVTASGTLLVLARAVSPAIWSDFKALRDAQPVDRRGNLLIYQGTYFAECSCGRLNRSRGKVA